MDQTDDLETGVHERKLDDPIDHWLGDNANKTQNSGM